MTRRIDLSTPIDVRGVELDQATWLQNTVITPATNASLATSLQIQGSAISPICNGVNPVLITCTCQIQVTGTVGATAKGLISIVDITNGLPSGANAIDLWDIQTPIGAVANAAFPFSVDVSIGTPPAGQRLYACFVWGNNGVVGVTNLASATNKNMLRAVYEQ